MQTTTGETETLFAENSKTKLFVDNVPQCQNGNCGGVDHCDVDKVDLADYGDSGDEVDVTDYGVDDADVVGSYCGDEVDVADVGVADVK